MSKGGAVGVAQSPVAHDADAKWTQPRARRFAKA
jgi:hypothetical protein